MQVRKTLQFNGFLVLFICIVALGLMLACGGGGGGGEGNNSAYNPQATTPADSEDAMVGNTFSYEVPSSLSGDLNYVLLSGPSGAEIGSTGILVWTPNSSGTFTFTIRVQNDAGQEEIKDIVVNVITESENTAPQITATPANLATAGQIFTYQIMATDPHAPLAYELSSAPDGMTVDANGLITWTPSITNEGTVVSVSTTVSDSFGAASSYTFAVSVKAEPPAIADIPDQTVSIGGAEFIYDKVSVTDNQTPLTLALINNPPNMTISAEGVISWNASTLYAGQTLTITVKATDSAGNVGTKDFNISVINILPLVEPIDDRTIAAGTSFTYQVEATDANQPLTYELSTAPTGMTITSTGQIDWTSTTTGIFPVTVKVTDGLDGSVEESFTITVTNDGPVVDAIVDQTASASVLLTLNVTASDDNSPLSYALTAGAPAGMTIDPATGVITWTPNDSDSGLDYNNITVTVTDDLGAESSVSFNVAVDNVDPAVTAIGDEILNVAQPLTIDVTATDNNTPLTYSLSGAPTGMTIDGNGQITYTPPNIHQNTIYNVTVRVTDAHVANPLFTDESFQITINNKPPTIANIPNQKIATNQKFIFDVASYSFDPNLPLSYAIDGGTTSVGANPAPSIDATTGVVSWTPTTTGDFVIGIQVSDQPALSSVKTFNINVSALQIIAPATLPSIGLGGDYQYRLTPSGGATPYAWSVTVGALPTGLSIDATTGVIYGTTTAAGTFNFTIQLQEGGAGTTTKAFTINVIDGPVIETDTIANGFINYPYLFTMEITGGTEPYEWAVFSGELPEGLSLDPDTGVISGTPITADNYSFTLIVVDDDNSSYTKSFGVNVFEQGNWQDDFINFEKVASSTDTYVQAGEAKLALTKYGSKIPITNASGSILSDYQVKVTVPWNDMMQPDFDDIRFYSDPQGATPLYYYTNPTLTDYALSSQGASASGGGNPAYAIDGAYSTANYWQVGAAQNETLYLLGTIDLGTIRYVDTIKTHLWDGDARWYYNYKIEVSPDNSVWTTWFDGTGSGVNYQGLQTNAGALTAIRYIKYSISGNTVNTSGHIIEVYAYGANAEQDFWVKVPNIPTTGTNIYMYYGDPLAVSASDPQNTFSFYENFSDNNYTANVPWTVSAGTWTAASGYLSGNIDNGVIMTNNQYSADQYLFKFLQTGYSNSDDYANWYFRYQDSSHYLRLEMRTYRNYSPGSYYYLRLLNNNGSGETQIWMNTSYNWYNEHGNWFWIKFQIFGSTLRYKLWKNGSSEPAGWTGTYANPVTYSNTGNVRVYSYRTGDGAGVGFDEAMFSKYVSPEPVPTIGSPGIVVVGNDLDGTLISEEIEPASLSTWDEFWFTDLKASNGGPAGTDIKYYVEYDNAGTWTLVPDGEIPGNSTGLTASPVDISLVSDSKIRLRAEFTSGTLGISPTLIKWGATWTP